MIRFLLRALGFLLIVAAFAAIVVDGTRSIAGGRPLFYALGDTAAWLGGARFEAATGYLSKAPSLVQTFATALLGAPGWVVTGLLGLLLLVLGRSPPDGIGRPVRRS